MRKITILFSLIICLNSVFAQSDKEFKQMFVDAWTFFLYENYDEALPLYMNMVDQGKSNANIDYAIGMSYLFGPGQDRSKAIPFLKSASQSVSKTYKEGSYKETNAPEESFYYLGRAYKVNYKFDEALEAYSTYKGLLGVDEVYAIEMVDLQMQHCHNAKEIIVNAVNIKKTNLGEDFNTVDDNYNAVYSADGNTMAFTTRMDIYDREYDETNSFDFIYLAIKDANDNWTSAKDITRRIVSDGFSSVTSINADGTKMLMYTDDWGVPNIYETHKEGRAWSPIEKIKKPISTKDNEFHACFGENDNVMYFTSNRPGGQGGSDIYITFSDADGKWGEPINLGTSINTPYNEETPFLLPDGKTMYFASEGHYSMGGLDIFTSTKQESGEWSVPINIGYPINSPDDDKFFFSFEKGKKALFAMRESDSYGKRDIYEIELLDVEIEEVVPVELIAEENIEIQDTLDQTIPEDDGIVTAQDNTSFITYGGDLYAKTDSVEETPPETRTEEIVTSPVVRDFLIKGRLSLQDNKDLTSAFTIDLYDNSTNQMIANLPPDMYSGSFSYSVKSGNYKLTFQGEGYESETKYVDIPEDYASNDVMVNVSLVPIEVSSGEYYVSKSVFFEFNDYSLNRDAQMEIEKLYQVMDKNPSLYVEVTGHTDSKGTDQYNQQLSVNRARSVVNYIKDKGINTQRFVSKGFGERDLVAINENPDGSDNPEGRKFNRRVDVKILRGGDNVVINEIHIPSNLIFRVPASYTIWLTESEKELPPSHFNQYPNDAINNVWVFPTENGFMYTVGQYQDKSKAVYLLNKAIDVGFPDAEIIDSEEFNKQKVTGTPEYKTAKKKEAKEQKSGTYTIQILALRNPIELSYFEDLVGIQKYTGEDNIHRYYYGKFKGMEMANAELQKIINLGYSDAFVINMDMYK